MPDDLVLLLPPSLGQRGGGVRGSDGGQFSRQLARPRAALRRALSTELSAADPTRLERLLGARGNLLEGAVAANHRFSAGRAPVLPAWQRFDGVVWGALGAAELEAAALGQLFIPTACYGLVGALDPIAEHRLSFSVSLGGLGGLAPWWRPRLTALAREIWSGATVVDLLPAEHAAAIDLEALRQVATVISVRFLDATTRRAVGHDAKAVKGQLARVLVTEGLAAARTFTFEGWRASEVDDGLEVRAPSKPR